MSHYGFQNYVLNNNIHDVKNMLETYKNNKTMMFLFDLSISLKQAAFKGHLEIAELLVKYGANINVDQGEPLSVASQEGKFDVVKYLVSKGANVQAENNFAIRKSSERGHYEIVKFLYENGADIHAENNYALRKACERQHFEIVQYLIQQGADVNVDDDFCLRKIVNLNNLQIMKLLIDNGANIHVDNDYILRYATDYNFYDITEYLIKKGVDIINNSDAIVNSCRRGNVRIVKLLLKNGVNIHINNEMPFKVATINRHTNVIKYLLKTINYQKEILNHLLEFSSDEGNLKVIKMLLKKNADINSNDRSPIKKASAKGRIKIVKYLLHRGAEINNLNLEQIEEKCQSEEDKKIIKEIYNLYFKFEKDDETILKTINKCPICYLSMENKEKVRCGLCNNVFDKTCMVRWLKTNYSCPYCREGNKFFLLSH